MRFLELRVAYKDGPVPPKQVLDKSSIIDAFKDWKVYSEHEIFVDKVRDLTWTYSTCISLGVRRIHPNVQY